MNLTDYSVITQSYFYKCCCIKSINSIDNVLNNNKNNKRIIKKNVVKIVDTPKSNDKIYNNTIDILC